MPQQHSPIQFGRHKLTVRTLSHTSLHLDTLKLKTPRSKLLTAGCRSFHYSPSPCFVCECTWVTACSALNGFAQLRALYKSVIIILLIILDNTAYWLVSRKKRQKNLTGLSYQNLEKNLFASSIIAHVVQKTRHYVVSILDSFFLYTIYKYSRTRLSRVRLSGQPVMSTISS